MNLLKPYYSCDTGSCDSGSKVEQTSPMVLVNAVSSSVVIPVVRDKAIKVRAPDDPVVCGRLKNSKTLHNLGKLFGHLTESQGSELSELIKEHLVLFGDTPSHTNLIEHGIDIGGSMPIKQCFYRYAPQKQKIMECEVKYMLDNNIAVPSSFSWVSHCLLMDKSDKSPHFRTDYCKVNKVTKPDSYPLPWMEDCIDQVGAATFVIKFDLLKGHWKLHLPA